jgi:hypothetical protein
MNPVRLSCQGVTVGRINLPPFELRIGELVCLHMPCLAYSEEEKQIVQVLTGDRTVSGLRLFGRILPAFAPVFRAGFLDFWFHPSAMTWLRQTAGITREEAEAILIRLGIHPDLRLCYLSGNPKALLGLEAAWARGAEGIVFTTVGCNRQTLYAAVAAQLQHCPALHLSYAYITNRRQERYCFPGASCIELTWESQPVGSLGSFEGRA